MDEKLEIKKPPALILIMFAVLNIIMYLQLYLEYFSSVPYESTRFTEMINKVGGQVNGKLEITILIFLTILDLFCVKFLKKQNETKFKIIFSVFSFIGICLTIGLIGTGLALGA